MECGALAVVNSVGVVRGSEQRMPKGHAAAGRQGRDGSATVLDGADSASDS
jgi:hypothetical protein